MSDPVLEAAQALAPLLAAGADGAMKEAMRRAGEEGSAAVRRVVDAVRRALDGNPADEEAVAAALRTELDNGAVSQNDLVHTVNILGTGRDSYAVQVQGNAYVKTSIRVQDGDFKG